VGGSPCGCWDRADCIGFPRFLHWPCVNNRARRLHEWFLSVEVFFGLVKFLVHTIAVIFE